MGCTLAVEETNYFTWTFQIKPVHFLASCVVSNGASYLFNRSEGQYRIGSRALQLETLWGRLLSITHTVDLAVAVQSNGNLAKDRPSMTHRRRGDLTIRTDNNNK